MVFSKLFGLVTFSAGIFIASYYTAWVLLQLPLLKELKVQTASYFMDPILLLQLPALALALGITLIAAWFLKTEASIAAKKRAQELQKKTN